MGAVSDADAERVVEVIKAAARMKDETARINLANYRRNVRLQRRAGTLREGLRESDQGDART